MLMRLAALAGGVSPQTALTSVSVDTTCPVLISSAARTARHFGAPIPRHSSPTRTSSGPSSRNLIILGTTHFRLARLPPPPKPTQPRLNPGVNALPDYVRELALDDRRRRRTTSCRTRTAPRGRRPIGAKTPARQAGWVRRVRSWVRGTGTSPGRDRPLPARLPVTGPDWLSRSARGPAQPGQRAAAGMAVVPEPLAGGGSDGHRACGAASPAAVSSGRRRGW